MNEFERTIKAFLDGKAEQDPKFAERYAAEGKDIGGCCRYIISEVRRTGRQGFSDAEVFGIAVHYYDEPDARADGDVGSCRVVVNREIQLTEEEKARIEAEARRKVEEEYRREAERKVRDERAKEEERGTKRREEQERRRQEAEDEGMLFLFND